MPGSILRTLVRKDSAMLRFLLAIVLALASSTAYAQCNASNGQCNAPALSVAQPVLTAPAAVSTGAATSASSSASSGSAPVAAYQTFQVQQQVPLMATYSAPVVSTFAAPAVVQAVPVAVAAGGCASGSCNSRRGLLRPFAGRSRSVSTSRSVSRS